jgi:predicted transcriptional regulator
MNTKEMSKIRNKAKAILVEWLKTLLNEEEQKKVNVKNVLTLLPNQTHYWQDTTLKLQPWSYKWVVKKLKKNSELTYDDLNKMIQPSEKQIRRQKMIEQGPL